MKEVLFTLGCLLTLAMVYMWSRVLGLEDAIKELDIQLKHEKRRSFILETEVSDLKKDRSVL